jgi:HEAT repeat protein
MELTQEPSVRRILAAALSRASSITEGDLRPLGDLLNDPDVSVVSSVLSTLINVGTGKAIDLVKVHVGKVLSAPFLNEAALEALEAFARISAPPEAESLLRELLLRPDVFATDFVTGTCLNLLGKLCLPESLDLLLALLVSGDEVSVYGALPRFRDVPGAKEQLRKLMQYHLIPHVRDKAAIVLGLMGDAAAVGRLLEILQRPVPSEAVKALRKSEFPVGIFETRKEPAWLSRHWDKCGLAADALALLKQQDAAPLLLSLARHPHIPEYIRGQCLTALGKLGHAPALEDMLQRLEKHEYLSFAGFALTELAMSVPLEQCELVLRKLKSQWEVARSAGNQGYAQGLWATGRDIIRRTGRRFNDTLAGWPLGLPPTGKRPLPAWLAGITDY